MITFENKFTNEVVTFTGEQEANMRNAHMAAYLNASDLSPNAGVRGQDFGWRLAPEIIVKMDDVRSDYEELDKISRRLGIGVDDIKDFHILSYVADKEFAQDAVKRRAMSSSANPENDYEARVRAAREARKNATIGNVKGDETVTSEEAIKLGQELAEATSTETVETPVEAPAKGGVDKPAKK